MGVTKDPSAAMHTPPSASASGQGRNLQWATPQFQLPHAQLELNGTPTSSTPGTGRHRQNLPTPSPSPAHGNPSPQKEPGADEYISRLLRLARDPPNRAQRANSSSAMADFLASLGFGGAQSPAVSHNPQCDSVEQLQHKLRGILDAKATPTRAEHVAITIELRATVRFQLPVSESENGNQENLDGLDQLQSAGADGHQDAGQLSRVVFANDTLMNQPQDDPSLQRSVAKHIISTISSTDGSTWTVREVSRGTQGWTFTYLCKDSLQCWNRQNAKNPVQTIVGEFSQREPDPVLHARPAFDCRGSIVIAFDRSSRAITIKYDHTPLHKTVAELAAHFKPPPRQLGPGAQKIQEQQQKAKEKTPKKPRGEKKDKKERKKRESTTKAQDENGNPRKRKRKSNAAQPAEAADGPMIPPDYPGTPAVNGQADVSYINGVQVLADAAQQGFNDYPQGLMGDGSGATNGTVSQQPGGQPGSVTFPVNVSAAEANRRKEAATSMLSNAGVDPTTLSPEQFGIFSNQAPELQQESLNMLVKYGAERLRIVHPSNREGSAQASASTAQNSPSVNGPRTTKELVPQPSAQSNVNTDTEAQTASQTADEASTPKRKARKLGKSRTACFPCKARKTKCSKERPTCAECANHGTACEYAPQKPRNRGKTAKKSEAIVVDDDEEEEEDEEEEQAEEEEQEDAEGAEDAEDAEEEGDQDDDDQQANSQDYPYPQMNIGNMVTNTDTTPQNTHATQNYYQPAPGLAMPQADPYSTTSQPLSTASSQRNNYSHALPEVMQPVHHPPPPIPAPAGTIAPSETRRWTAFGNGGLSSASGSSKARRSLPSEPQHSSGQSVPTTNPQPSDWAQSTSTTMPAMPATTMASVSPQMSYDNRSGHGDRQKNQSPSNDSVQQAAAMASTVMQQAQAQAQARQSPVATAAMMAQARKSPYQQVAAPRTTSRTGQRNQSRTPVTDQARGYQPPPPVDMSQQQTPRTNTHYDTSHMPSGSGYNDYGRYGGSNAVTSQQQAMPVAQATPNTMSTSYQTTPSTTANQWSSSSSRNDRSYGTNSSYQAPNMYTQSSAAKAAPASRQNFNMRSGAQQQQHTRGSSGSYSQQQPQQQANYSSYSGSTHQNQPSQTSNQKQQPPSWYFQNTHNTSIHAGSQSSGYNYEPWSGV
ncbi:uncharacterized protein B0J16DRAFT_339174 [Fusarium flagelliforme]|uniref:ATP-dependent dna helicase 2 subunit 1 n=1 Tax=Fusarium flagelliforme TaxID=2675880 RepID=A0A395MMV8_9HYPO|nr:uncharacterized protein B0J16DRAFT_339174 [Fusarium flagelliforme]KAH7189260.1 hypothetical protein B0J16DRAFT_339174 [Fusarium flagelliforme]RFN49278.1 ATP-dependent dna helicase 2 subunit 1 [Fusarium flagelliforme]